MKSNIYNKYLKRSISNNKILALLCYPLFCLSLIIPKNKKIKIFGSMNGFAIADNSKYMYINEYKKGYYFITKNKTEIIKPIFENNYPVYCFSIKGFFLQIIASEVYYTHSIFDFFAPIIMGANVIALWHGVPFKKIGSITASEIKLNHNRATLRKIIAKIFKKLFPYTNYMYCNNVICPDSFFEKRYKSCFQNSKPNIVIKQFPRVEYARKNIKIRAILYCPTYRNKRDINDLLNKTGIISDDFISWLENNKIEFIIRPHPIDAKHIKSINEIDNIKIDLSQDIYETITKYPIVITDYSSLYYDAEALKIKVYFLADDIEEYNNNEAGLFEDFMEILKKQSAKNINELTNNFLENFEQFNGD